MLSTTLLRFSRPDGYSFPPNSQTEERESAFNFRFSPPKSTLSPLVARTKHLAQNSRTCLLTSLIKWDKQNLIIVHKYSLVEMTSPSKTCLKSILPAVSQWPLQEHGIARAHPFVMAYGGGLIWDVFEVHWDSLLSPYPSSLGHSMAMINHSGPSSLKNADYYPAADLAYLILYVCILDCWRYVRWSVFFCQYIQQWPFEQKIFQMWWQLHLFCHTGYPPRDWGSY